MIEANKKTKTIETFLAGQSEEIEIDVKNVSIEDLRKPPYQATVDFEKIYYARRDHAEIQARKVRRATSSSWSRTASPTP